MDAVILLGGLGTRLRPLTLNRPKPLLPILNRPFISYQLDLLKAHGTRHVVLALGHKAAHFRRALGDGRRWGVRLTYSVEKTALGTGGAIRLSLPHLRGPAVILNGDVLCRFDLKAMAAAHRRADADATLALIQVEDPSAFGVVETDGDGRILRFLEKPSPEQTEARTINAGCYLFEPKVVARIPAGRPVSIEREVFPALIQEGFRLQGHRHKGYWSDIGTLPAYWRTHADLHESGLWPEGVRPRRGWVLGKGARVAGSARLAGTCLVGAGAVVGEDVVVEGRVTLGPRVRVGAGARIFDSVVLDGSRIGERAHVEQSVLGAGCVIGSDCRVGPHQVLADKSRLPAFTQTVPGLAGSS